MTSDPNTHVYTACAYPCEHVCIQLGHTDDNICGIARQVGAQLESWLLDRLKRRGHEFEANLDYIASLSTKEGLQSIGTKGWYGRQALCAGHKIWGFLAPLWKVPRQTLATLES